MDLLPPDLRRVFDRLKEMFSEEYALTVVFSIRTAVELHRAWHVSLLTSSLLQQIKNKFKLRMSWNLGVTDLFFRFEDGLYELHRRVPYDYDSEYQDMYFKTAVALVEGRIGIHDALLFQKELKEEIHTCPSGKFLRNNPGRLLLYPFQAATCCVIFFQGDWYDAGVSALCGITAGSIEWALSSKKLFANVSESKLLIDFTVGLVTGLIGGIFYEYVTDGDVCLQSVFLGTLYWFFYGTAFVVGLLEIIAGELQTGVTRFLAVSVKTFVLTIGSAVGMTLIFRDNVFQTWTEQKQSGVCDSLDLGNLPPWDPWWRIPFYLLCSVSVLGQYRFIVMNYVFGLLVQLAAYVGQEGAKYKLKADHTLDGMDTVFGDIAGAACAVAAATVIAFLVDHARFYSSGIVTNVNNEEETWFSKFASEIFECSVRINNWCGLGRNLANRSAAVWEKLEEESKKQDKPKSQIKLEEEDEATLVEEAVEAQEFNVWSLLMPAVYQLVPGSKLALYWYNVIFPPQPIVVQNDVTPLLLFNETDDLLESDLDIEVRASSAENALWLTSISLALGLILGLAIVRVVVGVIVAILSLLKKRLSTSEDENSSTGSARRRYMGRQEMCLEDSGMDPDDVLGEELNSGGSGLRSGKKARDSNIRNRKMTSYGMRNGIRSSTTQIEIPV